MKDPSDSMAMFLRAKHTVVCVHAADGDDVLYDTRLHDHCPECGSKEALPLGNLIGEQDEALNQWAERHGVEITGAILTPKKDPSVADLLECASAPGVRFW